MANRQTIAASLQRIKDEDVRAQLEAMLEDPRLITQTSYSANADKYPDHRIPFIEKHINYLVSHPKVDTRQYLANLRLMIKRLG